MTHKADWTAYNEERQRFHELHSQGLEIDIANLTKHISKLQEVAPKDNAGWMSSHALEAIFKLKDDLTNAKVWAEMM